MIVDTMTFEEIAKYLWHTVFSESVITHLTQLYYDKQNKYKIAIRNWKSKPVNQRDEILIFKPINYKVSKLILCGTPYFSGSGKFIDFVYFTTFHYRGTKYVAMKLVGSGVMFYSWHSLKRYGERYLGVPDAEIDDAFISDVLIYNVCAEHREYDYHGKHTNMFVTRDGAFLGDILQDDIIVARTFISQSEYFSNQKELDSEALADVQKYKADKYGDSFER